MDLDSFERNAEPVADAQRDASGASNDAQGAARSERYPQHKGRYLWEYAVAIWGVHTLACFAVLPWVFTWAGFIAMLVGWVVFGLAINLAYHRLLAHRGLKLPRWLEYGIVTIALCSFQDTPVRWVTHHRLHHRYSDKPDDAHTPLAGSISATSQVSPIPMIS